MASPTASGSFRRGGHFASSSFRGGAPLLHHFRISRRSCLALSFMSQLRTCSSHRCCSCATTAPLQLIAVNYAERLATMASACVAADDEFGLGGYQRDLPPHLSHSAPKPQVCTM